jgi:hypothetical protein
MLKMRHNIVCALLLALILVHSHSMHANDAAEELQVESRIHEKALATIVPNPRIYAYDLSSNADRLALFVASGDQREAETFVLVTNVKDSRLIAKVRFGTSRKLVQGYAPQVCFTPDARFLVVHDESKVVVLDALTLDTLQHIEAGGRYSVPLLITMAGNENIVAVSFGGGSPLSNYGDKQYVRTRLIDVRTGKELGAWDADDVPMSVSATARFVAVSDHSSGGSVMGVDIVDARSGRQVARIDPNAYGFKLNGAPVHKARIIAKFIDDDEVALISDGTKDQAGHDISKGINVVRFMTGQVAQELNPNEFGPTGDIVISPNGKILVTLSRYVPPNVLRHHWRMPAEAQPRLLLFSRDSVFRLTNEKRLSDLLALRRRIPFDLAGIRASKDGSVISVAEEYGITVLRKR